MDYQTDPLTATLTISREDAADPVKYQRAREAAQRQRVTLRIEPAPRKKLQFHPIMPPASDGTASGRYRFPAVGGVVRISRAEAKDASLWQRAKAEAEAQGARLALEPLPTREEAQKGNVIP